jgi:prepilin-type N-terminal cleavage/methylation domain-containing protein
MFQKFEKKERCRRSAFTLVEVMAAIVILALIAAVTFAIVFGAVKRSRHIDREIQLQTEAAAIISLVVEDIRGAYLQKGVAPYLIGENGFTGDTPTDSIDLLTTSVLPVSPEIYTGSAGEVGYFVDDEQKGTLILLRREQSPEAPPYDEGGDVYVVTDRLGSFDLSFSDGEDWFDEWDSQSDVSYMNRKLPRKVRIEVKLKEQESTVTYRTVVAPVMAVGR